VGLQVVQVEQKFRAMQLWAKSLQIQEQAQVVPLNQWGKTLLKETFRAKLKIKAIKGRVSPLLLQALPLLANLTQVLQLNPIAHFQV
jgi:hypothetical protein